MHTNYSVSLKLSGLLFCAIGALFLGGCASTVPNAKFSQALSPAYQIKAEDHAKAKVESAPGLDIVDVEKTRVAQRIEERIASHKAAQHGTASRDFSVEVYLTQYEKGNAFARSMLAGLGQIHMDGTIKIFVEPAHTLAGEFELKKTFAWGGMYGGATTIEDIEKTFADGVAIAATGQIEKSTKAD